MYFRIIYFAVSAITNLNKYLHNNVLANSFDQYTQQINLLEFAKHFFKYGKVCVLALSCKILFPWLLHLQKRAQEKSLHIHFAQSVVIIRTVIIEMTQKRFSPLHVQIKRVRVAFGSG